MGIKSNSIIVLLLIVFVVNKSKSGSFGEIDEEAKVKLPELLGPTAAVALPVAKIIPLIKPKFEALPLENFPTLSWTVFAATGDPLKVIFETVTPGPKSTFWTNHAGVFGIGNAVLFTSSCDWAKWMDKNANKR